MSGLLAGRYAVRGTLGEGAHGTTLDAVDERDGSAVAIKHFDVKGARAWKDVELAEREARVLASLSHPKLPAYREHFEEAGGLYLVMEKIEGTPLSVLRKRGPMAEADVMRLLRDADEVLTYLHSRAPAVIHRDLKPSNVIRKKDGSFAFVDFGAVRDRMRPEGGSTVVGTFGYMAPEQFQGRAGPASDVYAIGATALSLLTGEEPEALPHKGLAIDVHTALRGRASPQLEAALTRMLEPNPDVRPSRMAPLLDVAVHERARVSESGGPSRAARRAHRAEARAQRAEERARRRMPRIARGAELPPPPWLVLFVITVALAIAQLAVMLALQVVVPVVLLALSVVFGRGLREAARGVTEAGDRARQTIEHARRQAVRWSQDAGEELQTRVGEDDRVRVAPADEGEQIAEADEEVVDADEEEKRAHRRT